jgi:hypothetical protein
MPHISQFRLMRRHHIIMIVHLWIHGGAYCLVPRYLVTNDRIPDIVIQILNISIVGVVELSWLIEADVNMCVILLRAYQLFELMPLNVMHRSHLIEP